MEARNIVPSQHEHNSWQDPGIEEELPWRLCSVNEIYQYAWFFFMQHGLIPWWMQQETPVSLEENIITAVRQQQALCRHKWMHAWAGNRLNIQRWVLQCSTTTRKAVLQAVFGDAAQKAALHAEGGLLQRLSALPEVAAATRDRIRCMYWDALFSAFTAGSGPLRLQEKLREKWREWLQADVAAPVLKLLEELPFPETLRGMGAIPRQPAAVTDMPPDLGLDEQLRVKQAGLVLLYEALPALFERLQWWQEPGTALLPPYGARAVHLLAFIAGGVEQAPEYDMALHKLLCGIPLHAPVEREIRLTTAEKAAAGALLDAVAEKYFPGGHVSRRRLCDGFLQREGRLHFEPGGWQLRITREAAALQTQLPWHTARIELPWMRQPLTVQWNI